MLLLLSFFHLCLMEIFQIWRLPCFSYGGLGVRDPVELCDVDFTSSQAGATVIRLEVLLSLFGLNTWIESKLLLFLTVKEFSLGVTIDYTRFWISFPRLVSAL